MADAAPLTSPSIIPSAALARLRATYASLSEAEQLVARFIEQHPEELVRMASRALARRIGVSEATITRCSQSLGYSGLRALKLAIAAETLHPLQAHHAAIDPADSALVIAQKVLRSDMQAIADTLAVLDSAALEAAIDALIAAPRIELYGVGSSMPVVLDAAFRFLRIGLPSVAITDPYVQLASAAQLRPGMVAFAVSHSGRSPETRNALRVAGEAGATCLLLTSFANSPIGAYARIELIVADHTIAGSAETVARRIAHLSMVDVLCAAIAARHPQNAATAAAQISAALRG